MRKHFYFGWLILLAAAPLIAAEPSKPVDPGVQKEKALGIGGFFFRSQNPKVLSKWYLDNLGINLIPDSYGKDPWTQEAGPTAFAPVSVNSKIIADPNKVWTLNFRVKNLDAMAAQLRAAGIAVEVDPQTYPNGRFAQLQDPEGNPIQLWEFKLDLKVKEPAPDKAPQQKEK